jgi:hypothetical protein
VPHARPSARNTLARSADARGVVLIEFLMAFVPVFVMFLGIVQLALLSVAKLVVQHAAVAGVRSAIVVLDDDPRFYGGTDRGDIGGTSTERSDSFEHALGTRLGTGNGAESAPSVSLGGPRMAAIRRVVHMKLAAIAPEPALIARLLLPTSQGSVRDALGSMPGARLWSGLAFYLPIATAVTFPVAEGADELIEGNVPAKGSVTVRVTHLVPCLVPLVAGLMCQRLAWNPITRQLWAGLDSSTAQQRALRELRLAPGASDQLLLGLTGLPMALLQAEATMPSQSALYFYRGQPKGKE